MIACEFKFFRMSLTPEVLPLYLSLQAFSELKSCASSRGWDIDVWSNKLLAESLDKCVDPDDPNVNLLLRSLATQAHFGSLLNLAPLFQTTT